MCQYLELAKFIKKETLIWGETSSLVLNDGYMRHLRILLR
jgi:hypothetical protein